MSSWIFDRKLGDVEAYCVVEGVTGLLKCASVKYKVFMLLFLLLKRMFLKEHCDDDALLLLVKGEYKRTLGLA